MNILPPSRRILNARTHSAPWSAASFDPIEGPYRSSTHRAEYVMLALVVIVAVLAYFGRLA